MSGPATAIRGAAAVDHGGALGQLDRSALKDRLDALTADDDCRVGLQDSRAFALRVHDGRAADDDHRVRAIMVCVDDGGEEGGQREQQSGRHRSTPHLVTAV